MTRLMFLRNGKVNIVGHGSECEIVAKNEDTRVIVLRTVANTLMVFQYGGHARHSVVAMDAVLLIEWHEPELELEDTSYSLAEIVKCMPLPSRDGHIFLNEGFDKGGLNPPSDLQSLKPGPDAAHDDYCLSLGLDLSASWSDIRTALRDKGRKHGTDT